MSNLSMKAVVATTVIGGAIAGALTASAALNLPTQSCAFVFNSNLKLGSRGADVKNLQVVLNAYPQTQVAASGAGSPGMETTSFGPATRRAVIKFQDAHLVELGITKGTGNVFAGTRGLLNQICTGEGSTGNTGSNTGSTNTGSTNTGTNTTGSVSASLATSQPSGMIVAGQAGAVLANLTFSGNGSVTKVVLQRTGVSSDSLLTNVYLYEGNKRITDAASVTTGGYVTFSSPSGLFAVNGSRTITVRADIATSASLPTGVGQAVGVKLNSMTTGGVESTYTNVMGNYLTVSGVSLATVQLGTVDTSSKTVDAGTLNYNVWSDSVSIGTRDTLLRAATFKYVGSAPVDSVQNLSLYVDGTKVAGPAVVDASNNNKITFDLGANPFVLKSGSHTIDVRGDVVKGSSFNFYFSIENAADLLIEDSNVYGVSIGATVGASTAITSGITKYGTITVNQGSVTVNVDTAFNPSTITGGATNMPIAQFSLKGYGEDVKVTTLLVTPIIAGTAINGLANVGLFLNGGQVGSSQNWTATTSGLTFNLGSSLIVPAGQTVTLTVKADIVNPSTSAAYTTGTVTASIQSGTTATADNDNAQGVLSNQTTNVPGSATAGVLVTDQTITIGSGSGTFARTAGFVASTVAPNTNDVKIGSFTLQAGSAEDTIVNQAGVSLNYGGSPIMTAANISSLTLKTGSTVLGTPVGSVGSGSSTFSFADITIPMNSSKTFDVYANLGSATGTVTADLSLTTRGSVSRISSVSTAAGVAVSPVNATLATPTLRSDSNVAQYFVGGAATDIMVINAKTTAGVATIKSMTFTLVGTDSVSAVSINGIQGDISGTTVTFTDKLAISADSVSGANIPVRVTFSNFSNGGMGGGLTTGTTTSLTLTTVIYSSGNSGNTTLGSLTLASRNHYLVGSKPTVTVGAGGTDSLNVGALSKLGEFTVTADAKGAVSLASSSISFSYVGITGPELATSTLVLKDGSTAVSGVSLVANAGTTASTTPVFTFTTPYEIGAGNSKTFSVWGTVSGTVSSTVVPRVNMSLTSGATFKWVDIVGGNTTYTGADIYNFPTNSYTSKI